MIDFSLIEKKYETLSPQRKSMLFSVELSQKLLLLAEEVGLTEKGAEDFFDEVSLIILEMHNQNDFLANIEKIVGESAIEGTDRAKSIKKIVVATNIVVFEQLNNIEPETIQNELLVDRKPESSEEKVTGVEDDRSIPQAESLLKEKLELRPEGVERVAQPLTREDLLNALSAKRTMASDVARIQSEPTASAPVTVGYENYPAPPQPPQP